MTELRIVSAALNVDGLIISLPPPARHHDLIHPYFNLTGHQIGPGEQGFLASDGRFVDRRTATSIAVRAGQVENPKWPPDLYSEDLW